MKTAARAIYDEMNTEDDIRRIACEEERLHLDFKERTVPDRDVLKDKETLKIFAKATSGFANADSGVLVVGVADNGDLKPFQIS